MRAGDWALQVTRRAHGPPAVMHADPDRRGTVGRRWCDTPTQLRTALAPCATAALVGSWPKQWSTAGSGARADRFGANNLLRLICHVEEGHTVSLQQRFQVKEMHASL
jgi:hypothetical protein